MVRSILRDHVCNKFHLIIDKNLSSYYY